jgi:hypothetical protein
MHNAAIISDLIFKTLLGSLNFFVGNVSFSAIGSKMRRNPSASDQRYKTFYCRKAPFTRTVVLLIFVSSDQFCQAVCPFLPGSPSNFETGIFLSLCPILCNVMSFSWMLTKIGQTTWQNWSDSKNRTDFGCFV